MESANDAAGLGVELSNPVSESGFGRLRQLGVASWSAVGVILLVVVVAGGISALSGILTPLVIAVILGTVFEPVVTWLVKLRLPRTLAAAIVLLVATALAMVVAVVVVRGFIQQMPEITRQLLSGWDQLMAWVRSLDIDPAWIDQLRKAGSEYAGVAGRGAMGLATGAIFGAVSFGIGTFFALYFLFFVLRDGQIFPAWVARITGQDRELLAQIDVNVRQSLRGYFSGTAVTALITGPIFVIPLLLLGIPLVIPMIILYFFSSFVPYVGAWVTGAFAVLIAFGFGGAPAALIVALSLLVSNGVVQSAVNSWALGSSLNLHPVMVLLSTIIGGVVAGVLGMVLGPPVMSAIQKAWATVRSYRERSARV